MADVNDPSCKDAPVPDLVEGFNPCRRQVAQDGQLREYAHMYDVVQERYDREADVYDLVHMGGDVRLSRDESGAVTSDIAADAVEYGELAPEVRATIDAKRDKLGAGTTVRAYVQDNQGRETYRTVTSDLSSRGDIPSVAAVADAIAAVPVPSEDEPLPIVKGGTGGSTPYMTDPLDTTAIFVMHDAPNDRYDAAPMTALTAYLDTRYATQGGEGGVTQEELNAKRDKIVESHGGHSVLYAQFGSGEEGSFYVSNDLTDPNAPSQIPNGDAVIKALADKLSLTAPTQLIPENADLNDYTEVGEYAAKSDVVSATVANRPKDFNSAFKLIVTKLIPSDNISQLVVSYSSGRAAYRVRFSSGTWTRWIKYFVSADTIPVASGGTGATTAAQALENLGAQPKLPTVIDDSKSIDGVYALATDGAVTVRTVSSLATGAENNLLTRNAVQAMIDASGSSADAVPTSAVSGDFDAATSSQLLTKDAIATHLAGFPQAGAPLDGLDISWTSNLYDIPTSAVWQRSVQGEPTPVKPVMRIGNEIFYLGKFYEWIEAQGTGKLAPEEKIDFRAHATLPYSTNYSVYMVKPFFEIRTGEDHLAWSFGTRRFTNDNGDFGVTNRAGNLILGLGFYSKITTQQFTLPDSGTSLARIGVSCLFSIILN